MFVLPGEDLTAFVADSVQRKQSTDGSVDVQLGYGLIPSLQGTGKAVITGSLVETQRNNFRILGIHSQYYPTLGDTVLGIVQERFGEHVLVDINAPQLAFLSMYEFENATKRNRPDLKVGDIIMARVLLAHKEMEPELSCVPLVKNSEKDFLGKFIEPGYLMSICPLFLQ